MALPKPGYAEPPNVGDQPDDLARATPLPALEAFVVPSGLRKKALSAIEGAMGATRRYWDKDSQAFVEEPDHAVRLRASELALAYDVGRPVERQVILKGDVATYDAKLERLLASPEGRAMAARLGLVAEEEPKATHRSGAGS